MNNLWTLIKVDLRETLDVRKFKENKGKSISFLAFLGLMLAFGLILSVIYNLIFGSIFSLAGENLVYSTLFMGGFASILTFSTSMFKVKSIYVGKDYEILRSMPIKKSTIIAAKIINLYLIELIYSAIIMIPNMIINTIFSMNFTYLAFGLIFVLFVPALPMLVSCFFSLFITLVADRFKFGNIINFILYSLMFVVIIGFSFLMSRAGGSVGEGEAVDLSQFINIAEGFAWINPTLQLVKLTYTSNYIFILLFIASNIILFAFVVAVISLLFDKVYSVINSYKSNNVYVRKKLETKGQLKTLLFSEYKRFFTSKYYFINCISSGICAIVMSAFMAYMFSNNSFIEEIDLMFFKKYAYVGTLVIAFGIGIATPASVSISIEGANFWMLKVYPIDYKKLALSKLIVSITVLGTCSIVSSIVMIALIQPTIFSSIMLLITPLMFVILTSILGLLINLTYYKLKWKNEQECVKNSAGVIIAMLLDWVVTFVLAITLVGLSFLNEYVSGIATIVVLVIGIIIFYFILMNSVENKISKIEEF